ncbi:F-box/FBD/LRR-repeat protein At1g13570-like isoform X1 [Nicotiana tabacum]|uniref:F-box/FBD/LRR-repeat protein At1g13570-like isoform X1 n=2 Tax=Nicotiana tabacum TaxID=4097 RepID=A0A1S4B9D9_TOBAC|nr:PREDICTED: F-box/FBD/LRR-repeat protein At1g13570-like isoform X1 [Nicotiana tabacum]
MALNDSERVDVEKDREDRISALPKNVIDGILELLPVEDAARTSILSKNWRYIWVMLPNLVLNKLFCNKLAARSQYVFKDNVDKILLQHSGDIVKFVLDLSEIVLSPYPDIDRWMIYITRNGVKELTLNMSNNTTYNLPSYIFNCPTLTHLELLSCVFKPPTPFLGFPNLVILRLEKITFVPTTEFGVINAPLLVRLTLIYCNGTKYLNIVSSRLNSLVVRKSYYDIELSCFMNCKNLIILYLVTSNPIFGDRSKLQKLLLSLPILEVLILSSSFLELLSAGTVPQGLPFTLNCLWHLKLGINFGQMGQISYALELIKSSHKLSELEIWVNATSDIVEAISEYLDTPGCLDQPLNKLKYVVIRFFKGSKTELLFVKLLFARCPSLISMSIKQVKASGSKGERNIVIELARYPRASPKAELLYVPRSD